MITPHKNDILGVYYLQQISAWILSTDEGVGGGDQDEYEIQHGHMVQLVYHFCKHANPFFSWYNNIMVSISYHSCRHVSAVIFECVE